ncbi:hypothetical protein PS9374_06026 [Planomonospora sphaerica]|uniref:Uncharacterized protein n=1 Tax=Planomonospora sphaerica TaxID=161355 RepID=A0A161LLF6_9ACTN|nr:hypothetical protein PS9374_06026 [Planomonospora sphaerica]
MGRPPPPDLTRVRPGAHRSGSVPGRAVRNRVRPDSASVRGPYGASQSAIRTAPANGRPAIGAMRTTSPVRGAWTIRPPPM